MARITRSPDPSSAWRLSKVPSDPRFFFTRKFHLPGTNEEEAYNPDLDYQDAKLKIVNMEGYDAHDFNLFDDRSSQLWRKPYVDGAVRELTSGDSNYTRSHGPICLFATFAICSRTFPELPGKRCLFRYIRQISGTVPKIPYTPRLAHCPVAGNRATIEQKLRT